MALPPLATDAYLERYLSDTGIGTWSDHSTLVDVLTDCKAYAAGIIAARLARRYQYSLLVNVQMMQEGFAIIALRELTYRRGNGPPASLESLYQEWMQKDGILDQIASGDMLLVDDDGNILPTIGAVTPRHSNLMIDRRFSERPVRVITGSSNAQPTSLPRHLDRFQEAGPQ